MRYVIISFFVLLFVKPSTAQLSYTVTSIDSSLLVNTNSVTRLDETIIEIVDIDKAIIKHKYVVTVLNKAGDDMGALYEDYDKLTPIKSIKGALYDAIGIKIKELKSSDIVDQARESSNLFTDDRIKSHQFRYSVYPYTTSYEVVSQMKGIFYLPTWYPQYFSNHAIEQTNLQIITPTNYTLRYKVCNSNTLKLTESTVEKHKLYTSEVKSIKAFIKEPYMGAKNQILPHILLAPSNFSIEDYTGNMDTWNEFGKFIGTLNKGKDILPEKTLNKLKQLTDSSTLVKDKVAAIYKFMQSNTRYISIQLGIGGWQPYDANYVANKGYGDCKALSNYMYSLLKAVGIKSHYALIKAGDDAPYFDTNFPSSQFNHAILCVPLPQDTIWLECTSQTIEPGYLSAFTADRDALIITDDGAAVVHTPVYNKNSNTKFTKLVATLQTNASLVGNVDIRSTNEAQDDISDMLNYYSGQELINKLNKKYPISSYEVTNYNYKKHQSIYPTIHETFAITANDYASITAKRILVNPNVLSRLNLNIDGAAKRNFDYYFYDRYTSVDTIEIDIPAGYTIESKPENNSIEDVFGSYTTSFVFNNNKLVYTRRTIFNGGNFSNQAKTALHNWVQKINASDLRKVVFIKI